MKTVNLTQGTPEWHAHRANHFNASDAPAMMGASSYKSRAQLMRELATGIIPEVDEATQRRFVEGHRLEALARPIAEGIIGDDLYPVTGTNGKYSASFDGLTISAATWSEEIAFEHKTLNNELRAVKSADDLPQQYRIQMEHQLLVSGAEKCLFMASKFDDQDVLVEKVIVWYEPDLELRAQILAGWAQFEKELAEYVPPVITEAPKAEVIIDLPALLIQAKGEITTSNMREFGDALTARLEFVRAIQLVTDQDFSNAEAAAKQFRDTCDKLKLAKAQMLEQTVTIGEAARMIDDWHEDLRLTALKLEKDVAAEKEAKKLAIIQLAKGDYADHIAALEKEIAPIRLNLPAPDFAGAMKGKRLLTAWHDAVSTALANAKIEADMLARDYRGKLDAMRTVTEYKFLFSDLQQIISKPCEDFDLLVTSRIDAHKAAEASKKEAERAAMQAQEEAKAAAIIAAEVDALRVAEVKRLAQVSAEEQRGKAEPAGNVSPALVSPPPTPEQKREAVIEHQDEISAFLNSLDIDDKKRQSIRPYLIEFVKFQALHHLQQAANRHRSGTGA